MRCKTGRLSDLLFLTVMGLVVLFWAETTAGRAQAGTLNYRLKWIYNASVIGDLYAAGKGYFRAAGLEVKVKPGGPERDALRELELGYADFGVASADQVIRAVAKGAPLVVVAQLFQVNPLQWLYRADKGLIRKLDDLKGKTIGITYGKNDEIIMRTLLAKAGIGEGQVKFYSVRLDYTPFFRGRVDLWPVYANTQAVFIRDKLSRAGEATALLVPGDFGVRFVANSVVTSENLFKRKPELVKRFVDALLQGWKAALAVEHQREALAILRKVDKDTPLGILKAQLEITRSLVMPESGPPLGTIDFEGWRQTERIMLEQGQIKVPVKITSCLKPVR